MTREEENARYDKHNPGMRFSPNRDQRLYGRCGCQWCGWYRATYVTSLLSAIDQRDAKMGSINICDRCPSMVKGQALGVVQLKTSSDPNTSDVVTKELCPACIEELYTILMMDPGERAQKAFTEPFTIKPDRDEIGGATAEELAAALFEKLMASQKQNGPKSIEGAARE